MKVKALRCDICNTWNGVFRNHCFYCGASRAIVVNGKCINLDYEKLMQGQTLQVVTGFWQNRSLANLQTKVFGPEPKKVVDSAAD